MAIQFARHPEGLVEHGKRKSLARMEARFGRRPRPPAEPPTGEPEPATLESV
jgi:hypothetical protein